MKKMKSIKMLAALLITVLFFGSSALTGCKESPKVAAKTGAQLWGENCQRCHNTPQPTTFSDEQWETLVMHMQTRALLTNHERDKITVFMQSFNH